MPASPAAKEKISTRVDGSGTSISELAVMIRSPGSATVTTFPVSSLTWNLFTTLPPTTPFKTVAAALVSRIPVKPFGTVPRLPFSSSERNVTMNDA
jgi:hypothetical protein